MARFCVFCGATPKARTAEHLIPRWLIELTGDRSRLVNFGYDSVGEEAKMRKYAFDSFKFPACADCNARFSILEGKARKVILSILARSDLTAIDFDLLLDWLDKIRVGLWLANHYLLKEFRERRPKFFIGTRIGLKDRMVSIYASNHSAKGIGMWATQSPAFMLMPSCFAFAINNVYFFNLSNDFLVSRRLGFPYPTRAAIQQNGTTQYTIERGLERVIRPVVRKAMLPGFKVIYQPIFAWPLRTLDAGRTHELYNTRYVREACIDWGRGHGPIFVESGAGVNRVAARETMHWVSSTECQPQVLHKRLMRQALDFQAHFFGNEVTYQDLPEAEQSSYQDLNKAVKQTQRRSIKD